MNRVDNIVNWLFIFIGGFGIWMIFGDAVIGVVRSWLPVRRSILSSRESGKSLNRLLAVTSGKTALTNRDFIALSVGLALVVLIVLLSIGKVDLFSLLIAAGAAFMPWLYKYSQLERMRVTGSYEGQDLVTELNNQYRLSSFNVIVAIDATIASLGTRCPYSKRNLARLSKRLKVYGTEAELREVLDQFSFAYKTEWSYVLSYCIYTGVQDGSRITAALDSLLEQFRRANESMEKRKRANSETHKILIFLIPAAYIGLTLYGAYAFRVPLLKVIHTQFSIPLAVQLFCVIVLLSITAVVIAGLVSRPKYDL